jgi:hypothetical protein
MGESVNGEQADRIDISNSIDSINLYIQYSTACRLLGFHTRRHDRLSLVLPPAWRADKVRIAKAGTSPLQYHLLTRIPRSAEERKPEWITLKGGM